MYFKATRFTTVLGIREFRNKVGSRKKGHLMQSTVVNRA